MASRGKWSCLVRAFGEIGDDRFKASHKRLPSCQQVLFGLEVGKHIRVNPQILDEGSRRQARCKDQAIPHLETERDPDAALRKGCRKIVALYHVAAAAVGSHTVDRHAIEILKSCRERL